MENQKEILLPSSGVKANLKKSITYGEHQSIQNVLMSRTKGQIDSLTKQFVPEFDASATIEWAMAKMLIVVVKMVSKEGEEIPVSRESINSLPKDDGQLLEKEVEEILEEKKS